MTRVKICGITNLEDARAAADAGADMIGFVFADSPRRVTADAVRRITDILASGVTTVGVFMDQPCDEIRETIERAKLDRVQLHGQEAVQRYASLSWPVIKRVDVAGAADSASLRRRTELCDWARRAQAFLLDPGAGSGRTFDWSIARGSGLPIIVSGGLTPENVGEAIRVARPYGVDVSSGVEIEPGRKDHDKLRAFVRAVREADADSDRP